MGDAVQTEQHHARRKIHVTQVVDSLPDSGSLRPLLFRLARRASTDFLILVFPSPVLFSIHAKPRFGKPPLLTE